jgi:predicted RNA-binding Zn-ribbon protein involved in translation (DUF1610 family)
MANIIRQYGTDYLDKYDQNIMPSHRRVMHHIASCRTPDLGGQKFVCSKCGKVHYSYHSCRNRHCPKCQNDRIDDWLEGQFNLLLSVPYFMATPTVPQEVRPVFRSHHASNQRQTDLFDLVPSSVWKKEWVCHIEAVGNGEAVLKYLAPYVYRVAISDRNILNVQNGKVTFRYKEQNNKSFQYATLDAIEFLRRFLQHVLPKGFVKIRYFGFLATKKRNNLDHIKERIGKRLSCKSASYPKKQKKPMTCPECGQALVFVCEIPRYRGPPW